jgi:hypothetical protein
VHHASAVDASVSFLCALDAQVRRECARDGPPPPGHAVHRLFGEFCTSGKKNADVSVSLTFAKQLKMIRGVTADRAAAIAAAFGTAAALMDRFRNECATIAEERALLERVTWGASNKPLGAHCAATVHSFFRDLVYPDK